MFEPLPAGSVGPFVVGTMAAAGRRPVAIDLLLGYLRRHDYTIFVIYRLVLAAAIVIVIASGWRGAPLLDGSRPLCDRQCAERRAAAEFGARPPVSVGAIDREEIHMRLRRRRVLLVALPLALVAGVALAAQPSGRRPSNAVINACVKKKQRARSGSSARPARCRRGERALVLERPGSPGRARRDRRQRRHRARRRAGPAGPAGAAGAEGRPRSARRDRPRRSGRPDRALPARKARLGRALSSLESLNGVGCHLGGSAGTASLTYDTGGVATLTCVTSAAEAPAATSA